MVADKVFDFLDIFRVLEWPESVSGDPEQPALQNIDVVRLE